MAAICPSNGIKSSQITTFNFKTAANCNLAAPTNFIFTNNVFSWDTVSGVNSYFLEFITEDNKTIEYYPKIESTSVGNPLFAGLKVKGRLRSLCESTNVPSELFVESQFIETKSILQNTAINGTNFPLFNASCNIIDPNVGVFENFNNKYVAIDLLNFPDNTAQTYYFRCTYGTNEYIDFPLYVEKRDGEVKVYYKSQDCSTFKNILIKEDGDHLSQKFSATSCIDIYIYPTFIELRTCLDAKIFGKKI